jgi:hypothetical protein
VALCLESIRPYSVPSELPAFSTIQSMSEDCFGQCQRYMVGTREMLADDWSTPKAVFRRTALCNNFALPVHSRFRAPPPMLQKCLVQVYHTSLRSIIRVCGLSYEFAVYHTSLRSIIRVCGLLYEFAVYHTSLRVCTDGMAFVSSFGDAKVNFLAGILLLWHHQERRGGGGRQQKPGTEASS